MCKLVIPDPLEQADSGPNSAVTTVFDPCKIGRGRLFANYQSASQKMRVVGLALVVIALLAPSAHAATTELNFVSSDFHQVADHVFLLNAYPGFNIIPDNGRVKIDLKFSGISLTYGNLDFSANHNGLYYGAFYGNDPGNFLNYNDWPYPGLSCDVGSCLVSTGLNEYSAELLGPIVYTSAYASRPAVISAFLCVVNSGSRNAFFKFVADRVDPSANLSIKITDEIRFLPVPEPQTWLLLVGGFALLGSAIRSRHRVAIGC